MNTKVFSEQVYAEKPSNTGRCLGDDGKRPPRMGAGEGGEGGLYAVATKRSEKMNDKQYVINGKLTKETVFNLLHNITTCGFIWRGFTDKSKQMIPSAAFYGSNENGRFDVFKKSDTVQNVSVMYELHRIAHYINEKNRLGEYPFEIPDELTEFIFPHTQAETDLLETMKMEYYPKHSALLQAMSYVQHYFMCTSLLDFSVNPLKALYFAIGEDWNLGNDSYLFGLPVNWFQSHKDNFTDGFWSKESYKFDLYFPSYYKNTKIRNQEGLFIYQLFNMECIRKGGSIKYVSLLDLFEKWYETDIRKDKHMIFDEINLKDVEERAKTSNFDGFNGRIGIFYVLLKIPKEEKICLKCYLNSIGINDDYMMGNSESQCGGVSARII